MVMIISIILFSLIGLVFFLAWKYDKKRLVDTEKEIQDIIDNHTLFVESLDERQLAYYKSLGDSWYKELVKLDQRIYDLEQKKLPN